MGERPSSSLAPLVGANFWLRAVRPELTEAFATRHDANVWNCLRTILGTPRAPASSQVLSSLALSAGGLGLARRVAAHWASWADCVLMVRRRHLFSLKRGFTVSHTELHHVSWQ